MALRLADGASAGRRRVSCFKNNVLHIRAGRVVMVVLVAAAFDGVRMVLAVLLVWMLLLLVRRRRDGAQVVRIQVRRAVMAVPVMSMVQQLLEMHANRSNEWHFDLGYVQAVAIAIVNAHRLHWKYIYTHTFIYIYIYHVPVYI